MSEDEILVKEDEGTRISVDCTNGNKGRRLIIKTIIKMKNNGGNIEKVVEIEENSRKREEEELLRAVFSGT